MENGYYLSAYIDINKLGYLYKTSIRHDMNMSLWKKTDNHIELIHYWELERITGIKAHEISFFNEGHAIDFINDLLKQYNLSYKMLKGVFGCKPLDTISNYSFNANISYHSICHNYSSLLLDTDIFYNSSILTFGVDGGPDICLEDARFKNFYSGMYSEKGKIIDVFEVVSPGPLWAYAKDYFQLKEGTLMALGSASKSKLINYEYKNNSFLNKDNIKNTADESKTFFQYVDSLTEKDANNKFNYFDENFTIEENKISMIIKEVHKKSIEIMQHNIDKAIERYDINPQNTFLGLNGGFALNCPSNTFLYNQYNFNGYLAPPCVNDSGLSLGIALDVFYNNIDNMHFKFKNAYYGDSQSNTERILQTYKMYIKEIKDLNYKEVVQDIKKEPIVWFDGSAEIGPRALGNRSILADPTSVAAKDSLNQIKKRQWWRPVAPMILEEKIEEWFCDSFPSPYMLHAFTVKKEKRKQIPAVLHLDNTARIQSINITQNKKIYDLIKTFDSTYGIPIICNTSLNDRGEPIVNTINDAINFILRKNIKIAVINGKRIEFVNHANFRENEPNQRYDFCNYLSEEEINKLKKELNPFNVEDIDITNYIFNPNLHKLSLTSQNDVKTLKKIAKIISKNWIAKE